MSQIRFNPHIQAFERPPTRPTIESLREELGIETIHQLSQNENPLGPSPKVIETIQRVAPTLSYYPNFSDIELREAIAGVIGRGVTSDHIFTSASGYEALEMLGRGFLQPGDEVIVTPPTFTGAYNKVAQGQGATIVEVPLAPETFAFDLDGVIAAINENTRLIMLCNPNNPTGTIIPAAQVDQLVAALPEHVILVADEVYHHFVTDPTYPDSLGYVMDNKNVVIVHSFSKAYGLAGMRLGYIIARPELANYLGGLHRGFHQNKLALAAGIAAAQDQAYLRHVIETLNAEMAWLVAQLDQLDIRYWPPAANFVLMQTPLPAEQITARLKQQGIIIRPQHKAGLPYAIRVSAGVRESNAAFITALEEILREFLEKQVTSNK